MGAASAVGQVKPDGVRQGGDLCGCALPISELPFAETGTTVGFENDYDEVCPHGGSVAPDVAYVISPALDIAIDINLCASGYDTKVYVYESDCVSENLVACNDDGCPNYRSLLEGVPLTGGIDYYIIVDGYGNSAGQYDLVVSEGEMPPPPPECPTNAIYSQLPTLPDGGWSLARSEVDVFGANCKRYDSFVAGSPVGGVRLWAVPLVNDGGWEMCDENPMEMLIEFYADSGGVPAVSPTSTQLVSTHGAATGHVYGTTFELYVYDVELPVACTLESGWISIQGAGDAACWLMWLSSTDGDGESLYYINNEPRDPEPYDLAFCLSPGFVQAGACCFGDGTCAITSAAECDTGVCAGDLDCDGAVNFDDIDLFVDALGFPGGVGWPHDCPWLSGDCSGDGDVTFDDIDAFVSRIGQPCDVWLGAGTTCDECD